MTFYGTPVQRPSLSPRLRYQEEHRDRESTPPPKEWGPWSLSKAFTIFECEVWKEYNNSSFAAFNSSTRLSLLPPKTANT